MRIIIKLDSGYPADLPLPLFNDIVKTRQTNLGALFSSVVCHLVVVALLTVSSHFLKEYRGEQLDLSKYKVEMIRLHMAQPLFFTAASKKELPKSRPVSPAKSAPSAATGRREPARETGASAVARRLELPKPREIAKDAPVILQPDYLPQTPPPPSVLPPMAFWARQTPQAPKPPPRTEVIPGRAEASSSTPKLAAAPVLAVPNRENNVGQVNVSVPQPSTSLTPVLAVQNSATLPVRLRDATESQTASFEISSGQPVNLMTLAAERPKVTHLEIPKGLQNIPDSGPPAEGPAASAEPPKAAAPAIATGTNTGAPNPGANPAGRPPNPAGSSSAKANPKPAETPGGSNRVSAPDKAPSLAASPRENATPQPGTATPMASEKVAERLSALPAPAISPTNPAPRGGTPAGVTRIDHPANGNFDVVIMQSAAHDDMPELRGILSGSPVFTVYLNVGDKKEWLLEYCVPVRRNGAANSYQVDIEDAGPVTPPYPISTLMPNGLLSLQIAKPVVLHGLLTAAGSLQGIKTNDNNPVIGQLIALLNQWQFRPAFRNKKPIEVEILVVVPARS